MNSRHLRAFVACLLMSALASGPALSADDDLAEPVRPGAASASAIATATVVNPSDRTCDELRQRTRSSIYMWGAAKPRARRVVPARCVSVAGQTTAWLVVEYRDSNGSAVTVTLDDGAVSILPPASGSRRGRAPTDGAQIIDTLLSYD